MYSLASDNVKGLCVCIVPRAEMCFLCLQVVYESL